MTNVQPFPNYAQMSETKIEMHPSKGWEPVSNLFWWKLQELDKKEAIHFFAKKILYIGMVRFIESLFSDIDP